MKNYFEWIFPYLQGKLTAIEKKEFEQAMKRDSELAAALGNFDIMQTVIDGLEEEDMRQLMAGLEAQRDAPLDHPPKQASHSRTIPTEEKLDSRSRVRIFMVGVAAGLALLMGYFFFMDRSSEAVKLAQAELQELPASMSGLRSNQTRLDSALQFYYQGRYRASGKLLSEGGTDAERMLLAWVYLQQGELDAAKPILDDLQQQGFYVANQGLVLYYLLRDQVDEALEILENSPLESREINLLSKVRKLNSESRR